MASRAALRSDPTPLDATRGPALVARPRLLESDGEPTLEEMLDDPVIQAVMAQDGVERQEIVDLVAAIQSAFCR